MAARAFADLGECSSPCYKSAVNTPAEPTDTDLLKRWCAGDRRAGDVIYRRHFAALYSFLRARFARQQEVEDLVQECFLRLLRNSGRFRGQSSVRTYLFGIGRFVYLEALRKQREDPIDPAQMSLAAATGQINTSVLTDKDDLRLLFDALRAISIDDQDLLELSHFQDLSGSEIAEVLGRNLNSVKSGLRAARGRLATKCLELAGAPPDRAIEDAEIVAWLERARGTARRADGADGG